MSLISIVLTVGFLALAGFVWAAGTGRLGSLGDKIRSLIVKDSDGSDELTE